MTAFFVFASLTREYNLVNLPVSDEQLHNRCTI